MKIFSAEQIRNADTFTILHEPITSLNLMERAAAAITQWILKNSKTHQKFAVFCGNGNNGGNGFAIARMLYLKGFDVEVFISSQPKFSLDAQINLERLVQISGISVANFQMAKSFDLKDYTLIDCLFGTGLSREISGEYKDIIEFLNTFNGPKISVDIPSGLYADVMVNADNTVFNADDTLTFQFWKKSFLHPETGIYCGKVHVLNIGLHEVYIENTPTDLYSVDETLIRTIYKKRADFAHKGNFGKSCLVAGSCSKTGAAIIAVKAALRTGTGLTWILAPECSRIILQISCPEAMFINGGSKCITEISTENDFTVGLGPGIGTDSATQKALLNFIMQQKRPVILDADALNIIAQNPTYLEKIPKNSILTPHPKEFAALFGTSENSFERLELATKKSRELGLIIVLKDHHTQTILPDGKIFYNTSGNSGMAKGGNGDALTGIITALLAQGYAPQDAAVFGVWLHGKAGDLAAEKFSKESMLPTDLIDHLGKVFLQLNEEN